MAQVPFNGSDSIGVSRKRPNSSESMPYFAPFKKQKIKFAKASWPATSDFKEIRFSDIPYVDKTHLFQELFQHQYVFLSRPRRFGKTLLVSTLNELFLGHKELFQGLNCEKTWNWTLNKFPVIKMDFSALSPTDFENDLVDMLIRCGKEYNIGFYNVRYSLEPIFHHLISCLTELNAEEGRDSSFVVLIDEYDKSVIDSLHLPEVMTKNMNSLNSILQLIKSASPIFSFITGSSRLARGEIFDGDDAPFDISYDPKFNSICGFTEKEISEILHSESIRCEDLKTWYKGYCFAGESVIYNPFSIANAIVAQKIDCYWVKSGSTQLLASFCGSIVMQDFIRECLIMVGFKTTISSMTQTENVLTLGQSSESLQRLFLQSGYLTISLDEENSDMCTLCIPNQEIRNYALPELMISGLAKMCVSDFRARFRSFSRAVQSRSFENIYDCIRDLFQVVGFQLRSIIDKHEFCHQRVLQAFLLAFFPSVPCTSVNSDVLVDFGSWRILFKLKVFGRETHDQELHQIVENAFLEAKEKGPLEAVIFILVFNASTGTLAPRTVDIPFFAQVGKIEQ
jgi:hypothetical protein